MTNTELIRKEGSLEYWLEYFGMPKENIENCITQIAQGYGACRYLEGIQHGAEAVNELAKETVTDCNEYSTVEEELDAFIKSGKAIKEENCGTYTTTYIDPLKVARHFAKWGAEHLKK